jgi:hypothetical protein
MPVTHCSCASGLREQEPEALKVGGYSSNGNVHENYIQYEGLSSIARLSSNHLDMDIAEILVLSKTGG